jgi:hypothetical protein
LHAGIFLSFIYYTCPLESRGTSSRGRNYLGIAKALPVPEMGKEMLKKAKGNGQPGRFPDTLKTFHFRMLSKGIFRRKMHLKGKHPEDRVRRPRWGGLSGRRLQIIKEEDTYA